LITAFETLILFSGDMATGAQSPSISIELSML
jgi:hypothetical protein